MIRFAGLGCLVMMLGAVTADDKKDVPKELAPFQGTWKIIEGTHNGKTASKEIVESLLYTFDGPKLTVTKSGKAEDGSFAVDPKKDPATIDITNPKGDKALGIYKFEKDGKLTICFVRKKDAPRPKGFDDKEADVVVLEKQK